MCMTERASDAKRLLSAFIVAFDAKSRVRLISAPKNEKFRAVVAIKRRTARGILSVLGCESYAVALSPRSPKRTWPGGSPLIMWALIAPQSSELKPERGRFPIWNWRQ